MEVKHICRTCLRFSNDLLPLYNEETLLHKIEILSSVQLTLTDYYPNHICEECATNVNKFYNFRKVIINSNKDLQERFETLHNTRKPHNTNDQIDDVEVTIDNSELNNKNNNKCEVKTENSSEANVESNPVLIKYDDIDFSYNENEEEDEEENEDFGISEQFENYIDEESLVQDNENQEEYNTLDIESDTERAIALLKIFKCKVCNKTFPSRFKLYNHRRTEHYPKCICNVCGLVIRSDNLRRHVQMHYEGPSQCKICGKITKNSESLRGHMLIHKGEIFTCELCERSYRLKAEYKRHLKMHSNPDVGKMTCSICDKKVRDLKKHMQSHTGERPHVCNYCSKGFTSPYALKVHTRQHTNERPYPCMYCPMAFPQKVSLSTHVKSKHETEHKSDENL